MGSTSTMSRLWKRAVSYLGVGVQSKEGDVESGVGGQPEVICLRWRRGCCGTGKEEDDETAAYRHLLDVLERAEDRRMSGFTKFVVGGEMLVVSGLTTALVCTLTLDNIKDNRLRGLRMWQYVTMAITVFAGLSIVRCCTMAVFWVIMSCRFIFKYRNLRYLMMEMKTSIDVTLWFSSVLFSWYVWFRPRMRHVYGDVSVVVAHQVTRFLIAACLGAVLWVGKNLLFVWLEADLHYRKLCERITRTIRQFHVLQIIYTYGVWTFLPPPKERRRLRDILKAHSKDTLENDEEKHKRMEARRKDVIALRKEGHNICKELLLVRREKVPVRILRRLCEEYVKHNPAKSLPFGGEGNDKDPKKVMDQAINLFRHMKGKRPVRCDDIDDDEVGFAEIQGFYKEVEPENLKLFIQTISGEKVKPQNRQRIKKSRCCGFCSRVSAIFGNCCCTPNEGPQDQEKKKKDGTKDTPKAEEFDLKLGRDEFLSWAVVALRNCWGLQNTLKSSEQIIVKLNRVMIVFVLILALIIWLLLSQIVDTAQIALLFSPLIAAKFIFSESTKNMFDGLIFALAMHPFSPGDRVIIKGMELLVTEIDILTTTFYNYQTGEELVYPNSELATIEIINLENNPDQSDHLEFSIDKSTALEDIKDLEIRIQMSLNERKDAFMTKVVKAEMGLENIKMIVHFKYVGSYLTSQLKAVHRSEMLSKIMLLLKEMEASNKKPDSTEKNSDKEVDSTEKERKKGLDAAEKGSKKEVDPLTSKPYIVDVTLKYKVRRMKHLEIIKSAVTESLKDHYNNKDFKVVYNYVSDNKVRMSFFVWKDEKQEISAKELDMHCASIFHYLQTHNIGELENNSNGEVQKKETLQQVTEVKVQPTLCIAAITLENSIEDKKIKVKAMENAIKRFFCDRYYPYDFDVKVNEEHTLLEIQAWMQFPHNVEEEKQQLDMEQIMKDNLEKLFELQELKEIILKIDIKRRQKPTLCTAEIKFTDDSVNEIKVELLENAIKRFYCEKHEDLEFQAKFKDGNTLLEIHAWMKDNTEEEKQLDLEQIIRDDLKNIMKLKELKDVIEMTLPYSYQVQKNYSLKPISV